MIYPQMTEKVTINEIPHPKYSSHMFMNRTRFCNIKDLVYEDTYNQQYGPALVAVWSKALPLTASCLSPLPQFKSRPGNVRKLPVT